MTEITNKPTAKTVLPKDIFDVDVNNHELLKLAYDNYLSNLRSAHPKTKKRGDVRGGGKKPWRQKGTGHARFGSTRNPIWRGGGVAFGPTGNENQVKRISLTSKRVAIRQALTLANKAKKIIIHDFKSTGRTSEAAKFLSSNKIDNNRILLVVDEKTPQIVRSTNNIQNILLIRADYLNVYHILNADKIVLSSKSVDVIKAWLAKGKK